MEAKKLVIPAKVEAEQEEAQKEGSKQEEVIKDAEKEVAAEKKELSLLEQAKAAGVPIFEARKLNQIILRSGRVFKPTEGVFIPTDEEQYELLRYYESRNMDYVVELRD